MEEEKEITIPAYMVEKLEELLILFKKHDELREKLRPSYRSLRERVLSKTHEEQLLRVLWHGLCVHEDELKESIERKTKIIADMEKGD